MGGFPEDLARLKMASAMRRYSKSSGPSVRGRVQILSYVLPTIPSLRRSSKGTVKIKSILNTADMSSA